VLDATSFEDDQTVCNQSISRIVSTDLFMSSVLSMLGREGSIRGSPWCSASAAVADSADHTAGPADDDSVELSMLMSEQHDTWELNVLDELARPTLSSHKTSP
jgi:hypothetical protein